MIESIEDRRSRPLFIPQYGDQVLAQKRGWFLTLCATPPQKTFNRSGEVSITQAFPVNLLPSWVVGVVNSPMQSRERENTWVFGIPVKL